VTRSAWPVEETRLLAIAWEMWAAGQWLVPTLNGVVQPDAPLLFWLTHLGWAVFGVNEWWPRLLPALFGAGSLVLASRLTRLLWPQRLEPARYAPLLLLGTGFFAFALTWLAADMLATFFVLLGAHALAWRYRHRDHRVWMLFALALALGLLAAGWRVALFLLPPALLAPLWAREQPRPRWSEWYGDVRQAVLLALVLAGVWWGLLAQHAGWRVALDLWSAWPVVASGLFAHASPGWWYVALLPLLGLPWFPWPLLWLRLWHARPAPFDTGVRFCMLWALPALALLSLATLKQPAALLPALPAFVLAASRLLLDDEILHLRHDRLFATAAFPLIALGVLLAVFPRLPQVPYVPEFLYGLTPLAGVSVIVLGVALAWLPVPDTRRRVFNMAMIGALLTTLAVLFVGARFEREYDRAAVASAIARAQQEGRILAVVGPYQGEFHLAARLARPMMALTPDAAAPWLLRPGTLLVARADIWAPPPGSGATRAAGSSLGGVEWSAWEVPADARLPLLREGAPEPLAP